LQSDDRSSSRLEKWWLCTSGWIQWVLPSEFILEPSGVTSQKLLQLAASNKAKKEATEAAKKNIQHARETAAHKAQRPKDRDRVLAGQEAAAAVPRLPR
jgi:hypothetical protein